MDSRSVAVVITDLDNTLFDWVETWHASFSAMLEALVSISRIPREQLVREIKAVHEFHGTSEYAFLIQEVPSLRVNHQGKLEDIYRDAIDRYRAARKRTLKLYSGVLSTLKYIKKRGALVVGYTESMAFYTNYRVRNLGLDGLLDFLYSPKDHDLPTGLTPEALRLYPTAHYDFVHTEHRYTPAGALKPNPQVLLQIISELGVSKAACIYIGDNRYKDVSMANEVGVLSVHAAYGEAHQRDEYDLLKQVTHWSAGDVASEVAAADVVPEVSLKKEFVELLQHFEFCTPNENTEHEIRVWQTTVDVQKHFNELSLSRYEGLP